MDKKIGHIVTHTHWDREWYQTFQEFRVRLVDLMDHTMEIFDNDPEFKHFMLDGQTIVLDDYLEIKPEQRDRIKKLVQERKLFVGPWYVLVDEFLVTGEALVRNLLTGRRIAREFGEPMKAGYLPDQFGHVSQIPQILKGFDIDCVVTWRGFRGNPIRSEYNWEAPDGTSVLMYHLPECGYPMIINLPDDLDKTEEILRNLTKTLLSRSDSKHLLVHNGVDHLEPQPILTRLIRGLNTRFKDIEFVHSNLEDFFAELKKQNLKLPTARGELKLGYDHSFILVDILSSRMYLKQMNDQSQRGLEKYAEPLNALNVMLGGDDYSSLLRQGWKYVMQNHPHDTIGGCSTDDVHRDMIHRFRWTDQISQDISSRALRVFAVSFPEDYRNDWESRLLLFNPTQYPFTGIVKKEIFFSDEKGFKNFAITDYSNNEILAVIQDVREGREIYPQFRNNPEAKDGKFFTIEIFVENLSPLGYRRYRVKETGLPMLEIEEKTRNIKPTLENEHIKAKVNADGTLNVTLKSSGKTFKNLNYFESGGDAGDEYNFGKPIKDTVFTTLRKKARIIGREATPFYEKVTVLYKMSLSAELAADRKTRSKHMVPLEVICEFKLAKGSKRIDVTAMVHNHVRDHRFRVVFPSGKDVETYQADNKFDVIERPVKVPPKKQEYWETPTGVKPHDSFVDVSDNDGGLAIITRGTPEHEVIDAKGRPIAITLLRAVGWLSRGDGPYRRGNAGPPMPTPDAQMQGTFVYNYSIFPHDGTWEDAAVYREALQFNTPPTGIFTDRWSHGLFREFPHASSNLPNEMSFFTVEPDCFVVTATKQAEDNSGMIIRVCNLGTKEQTGTIIFSKSPTKIWRTNLAERELEELVGQPVQAAKNAAKITLKLRAKEIGTIKICL